MNQRTMIYAYFQKQNKLRQA